MAPELMTKETTKLCPILSLASVLLTMGARQSGLIAGGVQQVPGAPCVKGDCGMWNASRKACGLTGISVPEEPIEIK